MKAAPNKGAPLCFRATSPKNEAAQSVTFRMHGTRIGFDKHGVESVHLRIGSVLEKPTEGRHLSTWLSEEDLFRLVDASISAPDPGFAVVWGVSHNARSWWKGDDREAIGFRPQNDSERFAAQVTKEAAPDPVSLRFHGDPICAVDYSRRNDVSDGSRA